MMNRCLFFLLVSILASCAPGGQSNVLEIFDEVASEVLMDGKLELLGEGFEWAEGPVWNEEEEFLLFSDVPENRIYKWSSESGTEVYLEPSGFTDDETDSPERGSNGLIYNQEGNLVLCQHGDRRLAVLKSPEGSGTMHFFTIADQHEGRRFNSPNDVVQHSSGDYYFTDPPYGLKGQTENPSKEIPYQGVYQVKSDTIVNLFTPEMSRPNGLGFSPDEQTLYVANSDPEKAIWMAFDLDSNGLKSGGRLLFDATDLVPEMRGLPDGLKVHPSGLIFATGPGGVFVLTEGGDLVAKISVPEPTANCEFDDDFEYLYLTSDSKLYRFKLKPL